MSKQIATATLTDFLKKELGEFGGFEFKLKPYSDYENHWFFTVTITDKEDENTVSLNMKVDYYSGMIYIDVDGDEWWEQVESDRWNIKYFWYRIYCLKWV